MATPPPSPPTGLHLSAVARAADVSIMTVSRVLRGARHVSETTRRRVTQAAQVLGYRPDPELARLMNLVRGAKARSVRAAIAVVRDAGGEPHCDCCSYQFVTAEDFRQRADQHGYRAEEFILGAEGLKPARLTGILRARGIEGVVVVPQSPRAVDSKLDYSEIAAVTVGYGLQAPALHRASTNMTQGILQAVAELSERGYRRIGLAITHWVDARADFTYTGALLHYQAALAARDRVPLLYIPDAPAEAEEAFCQWVRRRRPDVIISMDREVPQWLQGRLGLRIPEDIGFVVHDWTEPMRGWAGIYHRRPWVAAAAVDLLATQLAHNEHGIPAVPRQVLIPPEWIDGRSVRSRVTGPAARC